MPGRCRIVAPARYSAAMRDRIGRMMLIAMLPALLAGAANAFDSQGHRGARGLSPENTLAAFETALRIGVTTLELDLAMTKDGVLYVCENDNPYRSSYLWEITLS